MKCHPWVLPGTSAAPSPPEAPLLPFPGAELDWDCRDGVTDLGLQGLGNKSGIAGVEEQIWDFRDLDYKCGIAGMGLQIWDCRDGITNLALQDWITNLGFQGIGLQIWDCRMLDYISEISG